MSLVIGYEVPRPACAVHVNSMYVTKPRFARLPAAYLGGTARVS